MARDAVRSRAMSFDAFAKGVRQAARSEPEAHDFAVERRHASFRVRLFNGSSKSAVFSGRYLGRPPETQAGASYREARTPKREAPRPMKIQLREESSSDRAAKQRGVAVEAQTGDASFDERVFIDSPSSHETVRAVLASEALRSAVIRLFDRGFSDIVIDDEGFLITATLHTFSPTFDRASAPPVDASLEGAPDPYEVLLEDFATILREVPAIEHRGELLSDPGRLWVSAAMVASLVGIVPALGAMQLGTPSRCYEDDGEGGTAIRCSEDGCCTPNAGGMCAGMFFGVLAMFVLVQGVRGRSNSHTTRIYLLLLSVVLGAELGLIVVNLLRV